MRRTTSPHSSNGKKAGQAPHSPAGRRRVGVMPTAAEHHPSIKGPNGQVMVEQALRALRERFAEPLTAGAILSGVPMSRRRLHEAFQRIVGRSAAAELARLRVDHAKGLLAGTGEKQGWIALHAGFGSDARFVQVFERVTGMSPGEYRRLAHPDFGSRPKLGRPASSMSQKGVTKEMPRRRGTPGSAPGAPKASARRSRKRVPESEPKKAPPNPSQIGKMISQKRSCGTEGLIEKWLTAKSPGTQAIPLYTPAS